MVLKVAKDLAKSFITITPDGTSVPNDLIRTVAEERLQWPPNSIPIDWFDLSMPSVMEEVNKELAATEEDSLEDQ